MSSPLLLQVVKRPRSVSSGASPGGSEGTREHRSIQKLLRKINSKSRTEEPESETKFKKGSASLAASLTKSQLIAKHCTSTASSLSSTQHVYAQTSCPTGLNKLQPPAKLQITVQTLPEKSTVNADDSSTIWIALDTQCSITHHAPNCHDSNLDVVVIIDNSTTTSKATLQNACMMTIGIADLLTQPLDRLAVLCTQPVSLETPEEPSQILYSLRTPQSSLVASRLQFLEDSATIGCQYQTMLNDTIVLAHSILSRQAAAEVPDAERSVCHTFVLTPDISRQIDTSESQSSPSVPTDFLSPSPVPIITRQSGSPTIPLSWSDVWSCMKSTETLPMLDIAAWQLNFAPSMALLRSGISRMMATNIKIDLRSCSGCTIKHVLGHRQLSQLRPWQSESLLIHVSIPKFRRPSQTSSSHEGKRSSTTLMEELQYDLGNMDLFAYTLSFDDATSSEGNQRHAVEGYCSVARPHENSPWAKDFFPPTEQELLTMGHAVTRRLVLAIPQYFHPIEALALLPVAMSGRDPDSELSNLAIHIMEELKHHANCVTQALPTIDGSQVERMSHRSRRQSHSRSLPSRSASSGSTVIHNVNFDRQKSDFIGEADGAHHFWKDLGYISRFEPVLKPRHGNSLDESEQSTLEDGMLSVALDYKCSIKTDTLRSLSMELTPRASSSNLSS